MSYWHKVLEEILKKNDPFHPNFFTNIRDYKNTESLPKTKVEKAVKESVYPYSPKKHTQIAGANKKYALGKSYPDIYLTAREAQIVLCFLHGMSTMQVAKCLQLSRRTVEFYVNNMKIKLNCRFKSELINKVMNSDFLKTVDFDLNALSVSS